jgi:hypothetical protein
MANRGYKWGYKWGANIRRNSEVRNPEMINAALSV